jgi:Fe-S-cluster-containing dehydrogenase component
MTKYGMVIDIKKCVGCYNCFLTCREEYAGNDYPGYSEAQPKSGQNWIRVIEKERGKYPKVQVTYMPLTCMQCENATCVKMAKDNAVYRRPDGIVIIDPVKAKGQKEIVNTCPYRVIEWNEEAQLPQKCTFCAHLLDQDEKVPRCVESCPSGALVFGDMDDPGSEISKLMASAKAEALHPEYDMKERVTYISLPKKFVAGTVVYGDVDECAEGVTVTLSGNGKDKTARTNEFGDFEFDGLPDNKDYLVKVEAKNYNSRQMHASTVTDTYLGIITLSK